MDFVLVFQLVIVFFNSVGLFGITGLSADTTNSNPLHVLAGIGTSSCYGIPFSCTSVGIAGGALLSSILFFGAWAFATGLWVGFYGAALMEISLTCSNLLYLPIDAVAIVALVAGIIFFGDLVTMLSWRDITPS